MENTETNPIETPFVKQLTPEEEDELMWLYYEAEKAEFLSWYYRVTQ